MLQKQILSEKTNYDLSMLYLQNMLKNDDSNEELMLLLAQESLLSGNKDLAFKLLELLKNSTNVQRRATSYLLSYQLSKGDYFYLEAKNLKKAQEKKYKELKLLFKSIIQDDLYKDENVESLYKEASFLKDTVSSYVLVQKMLAKHPQDLELLSDAYYIARKMKANKQALIYIDRIILQNTSDRRKWEETKFQILVEDYSYDDALKLLKKEAQNSIYWQKNLITFYLYNKKYQKAVDIYMQIFQVEKNYTKKKEIFKTALSTLKSAGELKHLVKLVHEHENYFFKDANMRMLFLKIYMETGSLQKARIFSEKILKARNY